MKLYVLRHGLAEEASSSGLDYDRRLTPEGIAEVKFVAAGIKHLIEEFDCVLSSPLPRALETAKLVAEEVSGNKRRVKVLHELAAGRLTEASLRAALGDDSVQRLLVVGHEPDLSELIRTLTGAAVEMKKAGMAFIEATEIAPGSGVLRWLLTPKQLAFIGRRG